ncbi:MAG TPA: hypothetical protein VFS35_08965 [Terrimicrobiaceae bacterium]|nr:hypothetical protein [Terrimicrobiaceae bacterium]
MKIPLFTFASALCLLSLGCEMHAVPKEAEKHAGKEPKTSSEVQKALEPEPANPAPPTFFPTPKPQ